MNPKEIKSTQDSFQGLPDQSFMAYALRSLTNEPEGIWTSTELIVEISKGATYTSRVCFLYSLEEKLGKNLHFKGIRVSSYLHSSRKGGLKSQSYICYIYMI